MLTAVRLREASCTSRPEWDLRAGVWTIPAERMKGKLPHAIPITDELREIAGFFPNGGPFLFSFNGGKKAMGVDGNPKAAIDEEMLKVLREIAVENGQDPEAVELVHWTNHDIRRTVRTRLSRLKVPGDAREALLAHVKPGIERVYDVHDYFDEKREALEVWAAELRRIAEPAPDNVVPMRRERA
jgi:integrase